MSKTLPELQMEFIHEVARGIEVDWERVEIHYEVYVWKGEELVQYTSNSYVGDVRSDLWLSFEADRMMYAMWEAKPEGQAERWTSMDFRLDSTGKFTFDYGYGIPRMAAHTIEVNERMGYDPSADSR